MREPIADLLAAQGLIHLDGALATELERRGADLRDPLWSAKLLLEAPAAIRDVHLEYFAAGADVAITATYQATFEGFARRGLDEQAAARTMSDAVALALTARDEFWSIPVHRVGRRRPLVATSIGPYGALLGDGSEYRGHYDASDRELEHFHRRRLQVLTQAGADVLACETVPCLREALVLARLLEEFPDICAWVSFSCRDGNSTSEGDDVAACAAALQPFERVVAVGVNCTAPQFVAALVGRMRAHTDKPLLAYPNSGERYVATSKTWQGAADRAGFATDSIAWFKAGARLLGGCCRTTPDDIRELRAALADTRAVPRP